MKLKFDRYVDSLVYINQRKTLVFKDPYHSQII